jgi:hypothetical protein
MQQVQAQTQGGTQALLFTTPLSTTTTPRLKHPTKVSQPLEFFEDQSAYLY